MIMPVTPVPVEDAGRALHAELLADARHTVRAALAIQGPALAAATLLAGPDVDDITFSELVDALDGRAA